MATYWTQTWSRRRVDLLNPDPKQIELGDIAHSLSLICRFHGHTHWFSSVAEHCVKVSQIVGDDLGLCQLGLLHDAAEAYTGDIPTPMKRLVPEINEVEQRLLKAIGSRFGVNLTTELHPMVLAADQIMLVTEARDRLFGGPIDNWTSYLKVKPIDVPMNVAWGPIEAEVRFMDRAAELGLCDR